MQFCTISFLCCKARNAPYVFFDKGVLRYEYEPKKAILLITFLFLAFLTLKSRILYRYICHSSGKRCGDEHDWPDLKHSLVCGECKVLARKMGMHRNCSSYCSKIGRKCTGAWEEEDNQCIEQSVKRCEHDFGSYTSDAICECKEEEDSSGEQNMA